MEFSTKYISALMKGNSSRSSSSINHREIKQIINNWYDNNTRLKCICTQTEFYKYINLNFIGLEGIFKNQHAIQSGGGPKVKLILDLFAILLFITCMIYNQTQREEVKREINENIGMINDAIIQFDTKLNLTHQSKLSLPLVNSSDIMNPINFNTNLINYTKTSMTTFLRTASPGIVEGCQKPPTFFDSIPNIQLLASQYIPMPSKFAHSLRVTNVQRITKQQKEKHNEEHECYMIAFKEIEQKKTIELDELFKNITGKLTDADEKMKKEIKINLHNNLNMAIAFAYLAARFYFSKGTPPTNPGEVMAIMEQNIGGKMPATATAPLHIEGPGSGIENISPTNSSDRRRMSRLLVKSPPPKPSPPRKRLQTQSYLWKISTDNPLNQGGTRRRSKSKRSISKSKRRHNKTRKQK